MYIHLVIAQGQLILHGVSLEKLLEYTKKDGNLSGLHVGIEKTH